MTHLSVFSGIGGLDLSAEWAGFATVGQCEYADYPMAVLQKHWPNVEKWRDIHDLSADSFISRTGKKLPTIISGGFPCQPHSLSGKRMANNDERDLWPELRRVLREFTPRWFVGENVPGLLSSDDGRFYGGILRDLAEMGYRVGWMCYPAHATGAPFWGERIAIIATTHGFGRESMDVRKQIESLRLNLQRMETKQTRSSSLSLYVARPVAEPISRNKRNDDGFPSGLDRLKCAGNAVDPYQFYPVYAAIAEIERLCR